MSRPLMFVLLVAVALLGGLAATAPTADAYIYWLTYDSANSRVGRADRDGKNPNHALVSGIYYGSGVATDGTHVYWGESGSNPNRAHIGRAAADGSGPDHAFLDGGTVCSVFNVRANQGFLYWLKSTCSGRSVDRAASDRTGSATTVAFTGQYACGIATDATHIYWSDGRYIGRALLDGSSPHPTWLDLGGSVTPCALAVDAGYVYWTVLRSGDAPGTTIGRATVDGDPTSVNNAFITGATFYGSEASPPGLAVDGDFIYWTNQPYGRPADPGSIGRARLDGTQVDQALVPNVFSPSGLDVDSSASIGPPGPPPAPPGGGGPGGPGGAGGPGSEPSGASGAAVPVGCSPNRLILTDVFPRGGRTRFVGVAPSSAVGERVTITSTWNDKKVASPVVGPDLSFSGSAPLPPRRRRAISSTRYAAELGSQRSLALKFARRMYTTALATSGGEVTFAGRVVPPLARPVKKVAVRASASCATIRNGEVVARVKPSRSGAFTARFDLPEGQDVVYLRAETKVRNKARARKKFETFTLIRGIRPG